jgi:hypothetical protein
MRARRQGEAARRAELEDAIERMIDWLDRLDGDPDLEDEPWEPDSAEEDERLPSWVPQ